MIHNLAVRMASWLSKEVNQEERAAVMAYGLELLLGALVKLICTITIPLLLGILPQVAAAILASVTFRLAAGGAHCTAYYRCLIGSLTTFIALGFLARQMAGTGISGTGVATGAALLALMVAIFWAPADTPAKPITRAGQRRALKAASLLVPVVYLVLVQFVSVEKDLLVASALGLLFQSFTVTPTGYRFMNGLDRFLYRLHTLIIPGKGGVDHAV